MRRREGRLGKGIRSRTAGVVPYWGLAARIPRSESLEFGETRHELEGRNSQRLFFQGQVFKSGQTRQLLHAGIGEAIAESLQKSEATELCDVKQDAVVEFRGAEAEVSEPRRQMHHGRDSSMKDAEVKVQRVDRVVG